ncbi:MAG: fasciclin domain-containing protein [Sphingopyxis sp.]|nr:fasciclin domain-containing protein [Sphingopyxis sp.]
MPPPPATSSDPTAPPAGKKNAYDKKKEDRAAEPATSPTTQAAPPPETPPPADAAAQPAATIVDIATGNAALSTLATAVQAADLTATLAGPGPFTVFAPTNDAFAKLPAGTVDNLVKPENKAALAGILTYHVVAGAVSAADLANQIQAGGGSATLTTVAGGTLTATLDGSNVVLTDAKGGKSRVVVTDVRASNGIVHAVDTVVMPS